MARLKFSYEKDSSGIVLRLSERRLLGRVETVPPTAWAERASDQSFSGLARVLALADEPGSQVEIRRGGMFLDHATVASLSEPQALSLDLPPSVRFVLQIDTKNLITDQNFQISSRWIDEANRSVRTASGRNSVRGPGRISASGTPFQSPGSNRCVHLSIDGRRRRSHSESGASPSRNSAGRAAADLDRRVPVEFSRHACDGIFAQSEDRGP
jgi:hypothetical protein